MSLPEHLPRLTELVRFDTFAALLKHGHELDCYCLGCRRWAATEIRRISTKHQLNYRHPSGLPTGLLLPWRQVLGGSDMRNTNDKRRNSVREVFTDTCCHACGRALRMVLICAFVSGCVFPAVYEASWAEQVKVKSGACPVIDGTYENAGEQFYKGKDGVFVRETRSLAHVFNGGYGSISPADDRLGQTDSDPAKDPHRTIRLQLMDDKIHIEALFADGSTQALDKPTRQRCRNSKLLLEPFWSPESGSVIVASMAERESLALGRAEDDSLLVYQTSMAGAALGWWPVFVYSESNWIRFPPVAPAPKPAPEQLPGPKP